MVDPNTIRRIVAQLEAPSGARVVEIGPGTGALTDELWERYENLIAVEIDERAVALLRERHPGIDVRHADVLDIDYAALSDGGTVPLWVIGNLPYNITSQILFGLLEANVIEQAVVTMQREVAERLTASPRSKEYGILTVMARIFSRPSVLFHLSPHVFRPRPDVWSSTVRLDFPPDNPLPAEVDVENLRTIVRTAFNQRRKTLKNSLSRVVEATGKEVPEEWATLRAEELEPAEYVELARILVDSAS